MTKQGILDLEGWEDQELELDLELPQEKLSLKDCPSAGPMRLSLRVRRSGIPGSYEFRFQGEIQGEIRLACVRCLGEFNRELRGPFDLRYLPISVMPLEELSKPEREMLDEDVDLEYYSRPVFDLVALAREQAYLALPMNPHCREDCAGLCPHCGADLNQDANHACEQKPTDPRWEPLLKLRKQ